MIYADFESILPIKQDCSNTDEKSCTSEKLLHVPCGASFFVKCVDERFYEKPVLFRGDDCIAKFLDAIMETAKKIQKILEHIVPMDPLTNQELMQFNDATTCSICGKDFTGPRSKKVKDHDHMTGSFRGAAHEDCNLNYRIKTSKNKIPCIIHNLRGYDSHLLLSAVRPRHGHIEVIPSTNEKYISFTIGRVRFIDSFQFMLASLDKLTSNLSDEQFKETTSYLESSYGK